MSCLLRCRRLLLKADHFPPRELLSILTGHPKADLELLDLACSLSFFSRIPVYPVKTFSPGNIIWKREQLPFCLQGSTALTSLTFNGGAVYSESPLFAAGNIIQYNSASPSGYGGGLELAGGASIICGPFNVSSNSAVSGSRNRPSVTARRHGNLGKLSLRLCQQAVKCPKNA
jgi:hypothetical protein